MPEQNVGGRSAAPPGPKCFNSVDIERRAVVRSHGAPFSMSYFPQFRFRHSLAEISSIFLKTREKWAVSA